MMALLKNHLVVVPVVPPVCWCEPS